MSTHGETSVREDVGTLCSPGTALLSVDKENGSALSSPINRHMSTPQTTVATKPAQMLWYPLEDSDTNRQDNDHGDNLGESTHTLCSRPELPMGASPVLVQKSRASCSHYQDIPKFSVPSPKPALQHSCSENKAHAHIKSSIHRRKTNANLTGDFSKPCILPLRKGRHEDLKSISPETLAGLIRGNFEDSISSITIVDCRYPYEYDGGHIKGAINLYSEDLIEQRLLNPITKTPEVQSDNDKRNILVFHCEFSWERGPHLSRFLRNIDRQRNKQYYPALHFPEMYLLHGGYRNFFRTQKLLCSPQEYTPMRHPNHETELRQFHGHRISWQDEKMQTSRLPTQANFKRL